MGLVVVVDSTHSTTPPTPLLRACEFLDEVFHTHTHTHTHTNISASNDDTSTFRQESAWKGAAGLEAKGGGGIGGGLGVAGATTADVQGCT